MMITPVPFSALNASRMASQLHHAPLTLRGALHGMHKNKGEHLWSHLLLSTCGRQHSDSAAVTTARQQRGAVLRRMCLLHSDAGSWHGCPMLKAVMTCVGMAVPHLGAATAAARLRALMLQISLLLFWMCIILLGCVYFSLNY
jgi:hypothetical protein